MCSFFSLLYLYVMSFLNHQSYASDRNHNPHHYRHIYIFISFRTARLAALPTVSRDISSLFHVSDSRKGHEVHVIVKVALRGTLAKRPDDLVVVLIVVDGDGVVDEVADGVHGLLHGFTGIVLCNFGSEGAGTRVLIG